MVRWHLVRGGPRLSAVCLISDLESLRPRSLKLLPVIWGLLRNNLGAHVRWAGYSCSHLTNYVAPGVNGSSPFDRRQSSDSISSPAADSWSKIFPDTSGSSHITRRASTLLWVRYMNAFAAGRSHRYLSIWSIYDHVLRLGKQIRSCLLGTG